MPARIFTLLGSLFIVVYPGWAQNTIMQIGIGDSLIRDLSPGQRKILESDFPDMVKDFTGFTSQLHQGVKLEETQQRLESGKLQLVILQGIEFAWLHKKDPKLLPLMTAVYKEKEIRSLLVVMKDSKIKGGADLKGQAVAVLSAGKEHNRLFAEKLAGGNPKGFFGQEVDVNNVEAALDAILLKKAQAAVVDNASVEIYKSIHPGRWASLQVAAQSELFPPGVIVFREGGLAEPAQKQFREGMLKANQSDRGREMMGNFKITSFEPVPANYQQLLADILKVYPGSGK